MRADRKRDSAGENRSVDDAGTNECNRFGDLDRDRTIEFHLCFFGEPRWYRFVQRRAVGVMDERDEDQRGQRDGHDLHPVLKRLNKGDASHTTNGNVKGNDGAHHHHANPIRRAGDDGERDTGAFHLGEQIEPSDGEHEDRCNSSIDDRVETALSEIGNGVGAESAQRRGHEQHEEQVPSGIRDGQP
jgi:hypothetical protein